MPHTLFPHLNACALCGSNDPLQSSHLLPDFLFRRLRQPSGRFYAVTQPRRARQAGAVARLLCARCEQSLSRWEYSFQRAFFPSHARPNLPLEYGSWLLPFAVSVSWRALTFLKYSTRNHHVEQNHAAEQLLPSLPESFHAKADAALAIWSKVLQGRATGVGSFVQHLVFLNGENVENEHSQVVGFTVYKTDETVAVFSQLGPLCILGVISQTSDTSWSGTLVPANAGVFPIQKQMVPQSFVEWLSKYFRNINEIQP